MNQMCTQFFKNKFISSFFLVVCLFLSTSIQTNSQELFAFNSIAAKAEIDTLNSQLVTKEINANFLANARVRALQIINNSTECIDSSTNERDRLENRFELLRDINADVSPEIFDQRNEIRTLLDEATTRQISCTGVRDDAEIIIARITKTQELLSSQFLTYRSDNAITGILTFPDRLKQRIDEYKDANNLNLISGLKSIHLFWLLAIGSIIATGFNVFIRNQFNKPSINGKLKNFSFLRLLFPKALIQHSSFLLIGLVFTLILYTTIAEPSAERLIIRIALGILLFGISNIFIDWVTGPMSPSANIEGLMPNHAQPLRFRLKILLISLILSFVLLGTDWLTIRLIAPDVLGTAAMLFFVATSLLYAILYLGQIPGLKDRFRLIRTLAIITLSISILAVLIGYQNFAGYLIHGITRTLLALLIVWILLWFISSTFDFLIKDETPTASSLRKKLGINKDQSISGLGFFQLITDIVIWLSLIVYLIYVWDESGTTVDRLFELVTLGGTVGNIRLVPAQLIGGIIIFTVILMLLGWLKNWIDRRWLQHIAMERGAREALITLFGYAGFIIALLFGLTQAGVDLGGLAIVSGALALGIGFGMQEIANNFVSGLILLFERPIRTGDFISVGDIEGFVRKISIRATEIETLDNQNVLVPNSQLVSGRVTNWVLRDTQGRLRVNVGVSYGSDINKVRDILEALANEHPEVITDGRAPAPRALFIGFGDSSLNFELRCRINRIDRRFTTQSDLNFAINEAFQKAEISIPFPQRDLHIVSYPGESSAKLTKQSKSKKEKTPNDQVIQDNITRSHEEEIEIPCEKHIIWDAITKTDLLEKWLTKKAELIPHIGGEYNFTFNDESKRRGKIDVLVPLKRIRFVEEAHENEEPLPTGPITTEIKLSESNNNTKISITTSGIPAHEDWEEDYNRSKHIWENALIELQDLILKQ